MAVDEGIHVFNIRMPRESWERLGALSRKLDLGRASVVRLALLRLAELEGLEGAGESRIAPGNGNPTRTAQAALRARLEQEPPSRFVELEPE